MRFLKTLYYSGIKYNLLILMIFSPKLSPGKLIRRYKRFLADIELGNGEITTIHCPNTGSMKHCIVANSPCWYSVSDNPKRKYPYTWEIATTPGGHLAGVNTGRANALVKEGIEAAVVTELQGYEVITAEKKYGEENSRIDFLLTSADRRDCYVEVKSVTLAMGDGLGLFPDSVSQRGSKHLRELMTMVQYGHRAVLFFCVQHSGIDRVAPADDIDQVYGQTLREAIDAGVEVLVYGARVGPDEIVLDRRLSLKI